LSVIATKRVVPVDTYQLNNSRLAKCTDGVGVQHDVLIEGLPKTIDDTFVLTLKLGQHLLLERFDYVVC
jgi:hypothetical protein